MSDLMKINKDAVTIREKHKEISEKATPKIFVKKRPDGFDYVEEAYMRSELSSLYPIWSWSPTDNPVQFLGGEWVIVSGCLRINDEGVTREFFSPGAARIQFKKGKEHTPLNVVDIDKNLASANTNGFKRAINRLGNIADDVYKKQVLDEEDMAVLMENLGGLDDEWRMKIEAQIESGGIDKTNLTKVISRINSIKEEGE